MSLRILAVTLVLAGVGSAAPASASPSYSRLVGRELGLECQPSCLLCHTKEQGGFATANTKVGIKLRREFHAECCNDDALVSILEQLEAASVDSDGDGVPDTAELQAGTDPNDPDPAAGLACREEERDGCALSQRGSPWSVRLGLLAASALLLTGRRWRRRSGTAFLSSRHRWPPSP